MIYMVTGGLGFIGSNYVRYLIETDQSARIVVLDALTYAGNLFNLEGYLSDENVIYPQMHKELLPVVINSSGQLADSIPNVKTKIERIKRKLKGFRLLLTDTRKVCTYVEKVFSGSSSMGLSPSRLAVVIGNIIDHYIVSELMSLSDIVVNFAAETHVDRSILNPNEFIKTDVYGTYVLLNAARKCPNLKKFVHISTDEVYGVATEKSFTETDPINPRNPYSASKAAADRLVYAYNQTYGLPVNIVRPSNNFGPYQYPEKLIPVMIIKALRNEPLPVYGDGKQIRDWLYVEDTVKAIQLVVNKAEPGEVYNIAGRNERENIEVVRRILQKLGKPKSLIKHVQDRPGHDRRYSLDDSKIRTELGFTQEGTFEEKLDYTIQWYLDNQKWWQRIIDEDKEYREFMDKWYASRS